jgi:hypothetical protein
LMDDIPIIELQLRIWAWKLKLVGLLKIMMKDSS